MFISVHWRWGGEGGERGRPPREKRIKTLNEEVLENPEFDNLTTACLISV